jgi:integrase
MPRNDEPSFSVQRLRGGYALVWWEGIDGMRQRKRRQLASEDRQSAEAEARLVWEGADSSPWTLARIMTGYLATIVDKPSHGRRQDAWKAMKGFWERVDPTLIDETMAREYRKRRNVSDSTARYELLQISTALGWAVKHGPKLATKPTIWLPPVPERKTRHLTRHEFQRFLGGVKADHARLYVQIGLNTMARPSAILDLKWDRVDFMRRQIDFAPLGYIRTAKRRVVVPVSDELLEVLQTGYSARTSEYVIERGGRRVACIKKAFQAASKRSGVHATPYTLRHTGAVWAAEGGIPMPQLAQFMGHDDDRTTQKHYARFSPDYLRQVANAIHGKLKVQ